ncbi:MAG: phosphomannomutase/phosphoglucomutase [Pseudomonadota bacterium]|nr:phosphomannomutase/phosphoglucomutase [Pseudomonadota bacterium]
MSEKKSSLSKLELGSVEQARPLLVVLLVLLAGWLIFLGGKQWLGSSGEQSLLAERDALAAEVGQQLAQIRKKVEAAVNTDELQQLLTVDSTQRVVEHFQKTLPEAKEVRIYPQDLQPFYQQLPESGYGRLAVVEASLVERETVMRIGQVGDGKALMVAVPSADERVVLVAMPLASLTQVVAAASPGKGYLAVRQGQSNIAENGDASLADFAESRAVKIAGSELRVAAGFNAQDGAGVFGLGATSSLIFGFLLLGIGIGLWLLPKLQARKAAGEEEPELLTLGEITNGEQSLNNQEGERVSGNTQTNDETALLDESGRMEAMTEIAAFKSLPSVDGLDCSIFRAYDIRGVVGQGLDAGVARAIGQAIGTQMHEQGLKEIVIGRDGRLSGPELAAGLMDGLRDAGCKVIDIGLAPTPLVYFAAYQLRAGSCVAVTGSHNPPDYNGFKIVLGGETLSGEAIRALYERIRGNRLHIADVRGEVETRSVADDYVGRVASDIQIARPLKVVVDAGNGAAGELGPKVLQAIGAEVIPLYCEIDGNFPNHHPDPSDPHNLQDLMAAVKQRGADIGIAFDGDGDRLGVVTPAGHNIFPDRLLMLFAADVLARQPGAMIVYDVKCTGALTPWILRHGGSPLMWKTGHSFIKAKMRETEAELAGEMSGHFFFKERWYGFDDGIYSAARLLEILAIRDEDADTVFAGIPDGISTPELKIPVDDPHAFIERFVAGSQFPEARLTSIDGVRADWSDGWGLVRASNTTPILVLRFEAKTPEALQRIQGVFRDALLQLDPGLSIPF